MTTKIKHPPTVANGRLSYASVSTINLVKNCEQIFYLNKVMGIKEPEGPWQKAGVKDHAARAWWLTKGQNRLPAHMLDTMQYPPKPGTPGLLVERGFDGRTDRERAFDPAKTSVHIAGVPFDGFIDAEWLSIDHKPRMSVYVGHAQDLKTTGNVQQNALREEDLATDVQMLVYGSKILGEHSHLEGVWLRHLYVQTRGGKLVVEVKKFLTKNEILTGLKQFVYPLVNRALYIATIPKGYAKEIPRTGVKTGFCHKYGRGCYYATHGCTRTEDEVFESLLNAGQNEPKKPKKLLLGSSEDADYIDVSGEWNNFDKKEKKTMAIADKKGVVRCDDCGKLLTREGTPGKSYTHKGCAFAKQGVLSKDAAPPDETKKSAKAIAKAKEAAAAEAEETEEDEDEEDYSPIPPPKKKAEAVKITKSGPVDVEEEDLIDEDEDEIDEDAQEDDEIEENEEGTEDVEEEEGEDSDQENDESSEEDVEEEEESEEVEDEDKEPPEAPAQPAKRPRGRPPKNPEVISSTGFVLYVDPKRVPKQSIDLTSWATKCAKALAKQYKVEDVRIPAGSDHPLSFGRWRGRLAALVNKAPKPGGVCVIFTDGDFSSVIAEELAAHATQVIHGA
jgi:hypothetical protein